MPVAPKSFWPAFAAFMVLGGTYTAIVARGEGNAIDNARSRWQQQKARGDAAMSGAGAHLLEKQEQKA